MYRHEKTFLLDFILLGSSLLLGFYLLSTNIIWLAILLFIFGGIRMILIVLHQIKWRQIYRLEAEEFNKHKKDN